MSDTFEPQAEKGAASEPNRIFMGPDGLRAGWAIGLFLLLSFAVLGFLSPLLLKLHMLQSGRLSQGGRHYFFPSMTLASHGILLIPILAAAWAVSKIENRSFYEYGLPFPTLKRFGQLAAGTLWGVAILSLLVLVLHLCGFLFFDARPPFSVSDLLYALKWAAGMLLVGATEEFMLRGFLQFTLARGIGGLQEDGTQRKTIGFWIAAFLLSIVFGLMHKGNAGESPFGLFAAGLAGFVLCLSLWRTGSLWWGIGWHTGWNWAQTYLYGVADSGTLGYGHLLNTHPEGTALLSGGTTGPEGSLFALGSLILTAFVIRLTLRYEGWPQHRP